ncbi:MAG: RdgB/HAM1 family non-canonical purine NTP pyrophosphatase [Bacteroidales bacterium]
MGKAILVMATMNRHKLSEVRAIFEQEGLDHFIDLKSVQDLGFEGDIPEDKDTLEGNATAKSRFVFDRFGSDCFSDDTGLEVEALNGAPGVRSARYAGEEAIASGNIRLLLQQLEGTAKRHARFRTVISLIIRGKEHMFEGIVEGEILTAMEGTEGFGYDPVFRPKGYDYSFASMPSKEKNRISHRYHAIREMAKFLSANKGIFDQPGDEIGYR